MGPGRTTRQPMAIGGQAPPGRPMSGNHRLGRSGPRKETSLRRLDILHAAAQIFRQKGYDAASMQDIASAVGLQKASLYHHVESKQEILLALLDQAMDLLIVDMNAVLRSEVSPDEKLHAAMRAYVGRLAAEADLAAVLLLEYRSLDPELRARHIQRRDEVESAWREIVSQGVRAGLFRPVDPAVVGFALLGVQNWMITWFQSSGRLTAAELADAFFDLFVRGLRAQAEPRPTSPVG
jgi:AcrR family transcriptional regulator